jgi:hypothetical protein
MFVSHNHLAWILCLLSFSFGSRIAWADDATGSVEGTVTLDGRPLAAGTMELHVSEEKKKPLELKVKAGKYAEKEVPPGDYVVVIRGDGVPSRYSSRETSALRVAVKAGQNVIDFSLISQ